MNMIRWGTSTSLGQSILMIDPEKGNWISEDGTQNFRYLSISVNQSSSGYFPFNYSRAKTEAQNQLEVKIFGLNFQSDLEKR